MADPTPSDRLALAVCQSIAEELDYPPCLTPCSECRGNPQRLPTNWLRSCGSATGELPRWPTSLMGWAIADPIADTAAAMLKAVRAADISSQPLAVGLADALDELLAQNLELVHITNEGKYDVVYAVDIRSVIYYLRNSNL